MEENLHILLVEDNPAEAFLLQESIAQVYNPPEVIHAERLGRLNVRYVAAEFAIDAPGLRLVQTFGSTRIYENAAWRPRARSRGRRWPPSRAPCRARRRCRARAHRRGGRPARPAHG